MPQIMASHQDLHYLALINQFWDTTTSSNLYLFKFYMGESFQSLYWIQYWEDWEEAILGFWKVDFSVHDF